jgi:hypothetical protein
MEINQRIRKWLSSDRDYAQGVELLVEVSKKSKVVGKIAKGESKSRRRNRRRVLASALSPGRRKLRTSLPGSSG